LANKSPNEEYLIVHQGIALNAIIDSVKESNTNQDKAADDAICFAIVLLMIAAVSIPLCHPVVLLTPAD
jgi:hypothetical protein